MTFWAPANGPAEMAASKCTACFRGRRSSDTAQWPSILDLPQGYPWIDGVNTPVPAGPEFLARTAKALLFFRENARAGDKKVELSELAKRRLFRPPKIGTQVICPHCGTRHAAPPGVDELLAFVCRHCGDPVEVPRASVQ